MVLGEFQALRAVLPLLIERPGVLLNVDNNKINKYHLLHPVSLQTDVFFQIQDV